MGGSPDFAGLGRVGFFGGGGGGVDLMEVLVSVVDPKLFILNLDPTFEMLLIWIQNQDPDAAP